MRDALSETVVALYAAGDAGGQLYAAARGLHELCGHQRPFGQETIWNSVELE